MIAQPIQMRSGLNARLGITLLEWGPEGALIRLPLTPDLMNSNAIVHGGIYCTLLDCACGIAGCYAAPGDPAKACVTLSLTTNFIASASTGTLLTRARITGGGRRVFFAEAEITDDSGTRMATATGAFRYITPRTGQTTD